MMTKTTSAGRAVVITEIDFDRLNQIVDESAAPRIDTADGRDLCLGRIARMHNRHQIGHWHADGGTMRAAAVQLGGVF